MDTTTPDARSLRSRLHEIIFEADTRAGRAFDLTLLTAIVASVVVILLDSVAWAHALYGRTLFWLEWFFTVLFTIEYVARLAVLKNPRGYATSFFGIVDLLAIIPTWLSFFVPGAQNLQTIRVLRLLRVFRVFKVSTYVEESTALWTAVRASRPKIMIFLFTMMNAVVVVGAAMHVIEGPENGFKDIPTGIYWAVVTLTTVGYGDVAPQTPLGRAVAVVVMLLGYGILAVPTGLVTAELIRAGRGVSTQACPSCGVGGHEFDAAYCRRCGAKM